MDLATAVIRQQERPNFKATARKYSVNSTTLKRRYQGRQLSKQPASSEYRQCLRFAQEETLIGVINSLTDRGIPPTSQIVRNLAQEIIGWPVGKNSTEDFIKRYKSRLKSLCLRNIDSQRSKVDYAPLFKHFYDLLITAIEKYNITGDNPYNWDEKGFLIGQAGATQRIVSREACENGRIAVLDIVTLEVAIAEGFGTGKQTYMVAKDSGIRND